MKYPYFNKYAPIAVGFTGEFFMDIFRSYNQDHRFYHGAQHIETLLQIAEHDFEDKPWFDELIAAIFYHDIIYSPGAKDNEEKSAQYFEDKVMKYARIMHTSAVRVAAAIRSTADPFTRSKDDVAEALNYVDMANLTIQDISAESVARDEYNIFKEYQQYNFKEYQHGRIEFLHRLKEIPHVDSVNIYKRIAWVKAFKPKIGVYAGSFNPFHKGHENILNQAERVFDKVIIAQGHNPSKTVPGDIPQSIQWRQIDRYDGLLVRYVESLEHPVTIIRGLRNASDLTYEQDMAQYMREQTEQDVNIAYFICEPLFQHISSTAIRSLEKMKENTTDYTILNEWNNSL